MTFHLVVILSWLSAVENVATTMPQKCCPRGFVLARRQTPPLLECLEVGFIGSSESFLPERVFDRKAQRLVDAQWSEQDQQFAPVGAMPECSTEWRTLEMTNPLLYLVTTDGQLLSLGGEFELGLSLGDFCLDLVLREEEQGEEDAFLRRSYMRMAVVCDPCSAGRVCLRSCCHHLQIADEDDDGRFFCRNRLPITFSPPRFVAPEDPERYALLHSPLEECPINRQNRDGHVLDLRGHNFRLFPNGSLKLEGEEKNALIEPQSFCLAFGRVNSNRLMDPYVRTCPQEDGHGQIFLVTRAYPICCTVSNVFLFLTFCVYLLLPELHRPLFGKVLMAFILTLFFAYLFVSAIAFGHLQLIINKDRGQEFSPTCRVLGFLVLFFFLSTFCWMNVLSYDIFRKFTRLRGSSDGASSGSRGGGRQAAREQRRRLLLYASYATGLPSVVTVITLVVEYLPDSYHGVRPGFGVRTCFFDTSLASFLFFHLYLVVMQMTNLVLFALTSRALFRTWRASRHLSRHSKRATAAKRQDQIRVIAKLFVVMGVTWMSEFVLFLCSWIFGKDAVWKYFVVNDVLNLSQGILIFIVLVCKRSVILRIKERLCGEDGPQENDNTRAHQRSTISA